MKNQAEVVVVRVLEEVVDPDCVDRGRSPLDSVDLVAFLEEEFGEVGAVLDGKEMVSAGANGRSRKHECVENGPHLSCDARNERSFCFQHCVIM